jgi:large subunit ribosomal protein L15
MRGFTNIFRTQYVPVNIDRLSIFHPETEVTVQQLLDAGIVKSLRRPVKILGRGELEHPLIVEAHRFSAAARRKIEAAGGRIKEIR